MDTFTRQFRDTNRGDKPMSGLSFEFILRHDSDTPHCSRLPRAARLERIDWIQWVPDYAKCENRKTPAKGILFGNWNDWSGRAVDVLDRAGYAIEWEDEWAICDGCGRAVRTSPDSYGWQPNYVTDDDCTILCAGCLDIDDYLRSIEDNPQKCCFAWIDPSEHGYVRVSREGEYESGLRPGQDDRPEDILRRLHAEGVRHVIFRSPGQGQFEISFETWRRVEEPDDEDETEVAV